MKVLIIGQGLVGQALYQVDWFNHFDITNASRTPQGKTLKIDISNSEDVESFFQKYGRFDLIINAAAISNVDYCEDNPEIARAVNSLGVKHLVEACQCFNMGLLHISTDYVFSGEKNTPYEVNDSKGPCSVYGLTKLEGEQYIVDSSIPSCIVRTTWIFGGEKNDFVNQTIKKVCENESFNVVNDQVASPTYVFDLVKGIQKIISDEFKQVLSQKKSYNQIYHITNEGETTRFEMAQHLKNIYESSSNIHPVNSADITQWKAVRPKYSSLSNKEFETRFKYKFPSWKESLKTYKDVLK